MFLHCTFTIINHQFYVSETYLVIILYCLFLFLTFHYICICLYMCLCLYLHQHTPVLFFLTLSYPVPQSSTCHECFRLDSLLEVCNHNVLPSHLFGCTSVFNYYNNCMTVCYCVVRITQYNSKHTHTYV